MAAGTGKGYMAKIGLDTTDVEKGVRSLERELKAVDKALENNQDNTALSKQKMQVMAEEVAKLEEKLATLRSAQEKANEALANEKMRPDEYRAYQREIVNTEKRIQDLTAELNRMQNGAEDAGEGMNELAEDTEKAGKEINIFQEILKADIIKNFAAGSIDLLKNAFTGAIDLIQQATDAYGKYEQLVGGVETLFTGSEDIVAENAANAFKAAGVSANQYMEQVTSFAASLINSLNGDTEQAAKLADQAIIDMSDNANKMGTTLESLQYAYQGFAKQNYTMLDNLKLGYGGTKTEMERLISDVNKWREANGEAGDLSIEKFSDVVTAIHAVQEQMGITGTTAKEAADTIQGSAGAVQAAWENLLIGLADPTADLDKLIDDLINSGMVAAKNMLPTMANAVKGIGEAIGKAAPELKEFLGDIDSIADTFIEAMFSLADALTDSFDDILDLAEDLFQKIAGYLGSNAPVIITKLAEGITRALPEIADVAIKMATELVNTFADTIPDLLPMIVDCVLEIAQKIADNTDEIINTGVKLAAALFEGLVKAVPGLLEKLPGVITDIQKGLIKAIDDNITAGIDIAEKIGKQLEDHDWEEKAKSTIIKLAYKLQEVGQSKEVSEILAHITNGWSEWIFGGVDVGLGLAERVTGVSLGNGGHRDAGDELKDDEEQAKKTEEALKATQKAYDDYSRKKKYEYQREYNRKNYNRTEEKGLSELLEEKESDWDKQYHYDKENQEEYWNQRMEFLKAHEEDSEDWWKAYNETEKKLADYADKAEKERQNQEKEREKKEKELIQQENERQRRIKEEQAKAKQNVSDAYTDIEYRANSETGWDAQKIHDEKMKALEEEYARGSLTEKDYKDFYNKLAEEQKKIDNDIAKSEAQAEKERNDNLKKQLEKKFKDLENTAKNENWGEEKLLDEKEKALNSIAERDSEIYDNFNQKIIDGRAEQAKKRQQAEEKAQKEILISAEKAVEKLVSTYQKRYDSIMSAANKPEKVTDAKGNERLVFADYQKKLKELKDYRSNLNKLKGLGLSSAHLKEIFSMDFDTRAMYIKELLNMGADNRSRYLRDYEAYEKMAGDTAQYEIDFDTTLTEDLNKIFDDVDGYESGKKTAAEWVRGFEEGLQGTPLADYDVGAAIVDPETMKAADSYNTQTAEAISGLFALPQMMADIMKGTPINIFIDNKKNVETTVKEMEAKKMNSASRT